MSDKSKPQSLSYKDAGVDINAGNDLVKRIKGIAKQTRRPEVMGGLGGFGALCKIPKGYDEPILVSGTDGVGTKLKLATELNKHDTIGIDLVAMCVNDLIVTGAEPLFFLDYFATGKLNVENATQVVTGIGKGCELAGCALVGGETAEMPGMYQDEDYDLAGFCVGVVEKSKIITGENIAAGNALIGVAASGHHSNGYSLIRKIIEVTNTSLDQAFGENTLGETLLTPTRIYVKPVLELLKEVNVNAIAHITGGGLPENIPRVLPEDTKALIDTNSWQWPDIFKWIQDQGNVETKEMYRTFNCGVGLVIAVPGDQAEKTIGTLKKAGENAWILGSVDPSSSGTPYVTLSDLG